MVILADDPLLAANVPVPEQGQQVGRQIDSLGQLQGLLGRGCEAGLPDYGGLTFVQELHRQVGNDLAVIAQGEPAGRHELAQVGGLDLLGRAERAECGP